MRDLDIRDIRIRARMYKQGLITEQEFINAVEALLQQTHVSGRSEQLCTHPKEDRYYSVDGRIGCFACGTWLSA